jgi:hypothetical protein
MNDLPGYYISDEYRTNSKSLVPGGWDVEVEFDSFEKRIYSNIKTGTLRAY